MDFVAGDGRWRAADGLVLELRGSETESEEDIGRRGRGSRVDENILPAGRIAQRYIHLDQISQPCPRR